MKKQFWYYLSMLYFCIAFFGFCSNSLAVEKRLEVLTSIFPIHQITRNITLGRDNLNVELMIPAQFGCPHNYALTPQDMKKLSKTNILIINGLGMEEFLGTPVEKANPELKIIDSSKGIKEILQYKDMQKHANEQVHDHHHNAVTNPHLFASPRMAALLTMNIAGELSKIDPAGAEVYLHNARAYAEKMNKLADGFSALGKRLKNKRIVTQHGVFDYLTRNMGLEIVAVVQAHAGQEPSAAEMLKIIKTIKHEKACTIFTEPQYPVKIGRTIAGEAGIATATLDPVATGPENAPLNYYEIVMRKNLTTLEKTLGTK